MTLKKMISDRNIKQSDIAKELKLSESQISLLVSGQRRMTLECAAAFAKFLDTSIDEIFLAIDFAKRHDAAIISHKTMI